MNKKIEVIAALWPTEENYGALCAVSEDNLPKDVEGFIAQQRRAMALQGIDEDRVVKLSFDPMKLAEWGKRTGRPIDTKGRAQYAAFLASQHYRN